MKTGRAGKSDTRRATFRPRSAAVVLVLACTAALAGSSRCTARPEAEDTPRPEPRKTTVRLTTGIPGAGFQPMGAALARAYEELLPDVSVVVQESAGSVSNVQALQAGAADIGFAFADVSYIAFAGRLAEQPKPFDRLRGMAVLQLTPLHLVVRADTTIRSPADLRGREVNVGPPGSGTALTSAIVLRAFGIEPSEVHRHGLSFNAAATELVGGTLDALFVDGAYPAASVTVATRAGARLIPVVGDPVLRLRADYPFLRPMLLPAKTYPGHIGAVRTIGVDTLLLCRADLDEELVHRLTEAFFDLLPALSSEQVSLRQMDLEQAPATPIPLHEGASRFYRERELFR